MPFRRFPGTYRRFSATPRRRWSRRRTNGTTETRRQYAQMHLRSSFINHQDASGPSASLQNPSFLVQALTPWANAPSGGYDRSWELRGLIWQMVTWHSSYDDSTGNPAPGVYLADNADQVLCPFAAMFFVDHTDYQGAPVSVISPPFGPFVTSPPIASPSSAPADDEFMPTRVLKRKVSTIQSGFVSGQTSEGTANYGKGVSNFHWSGVLRRRVSISARQGLYLGFYALPPIGGFPEGNNDIGYVIECNLVYYYRLTR